MNTRLILLFSALALFASCAPTPKPVAKISAEPRPVQAYGIMDNMPNHQMAKMAAENRARAALGTLVSIDAISFSYASIDKNSVVNTNTVHQSATSDRMGGHPIDRGWVAKAHGLIDASTVSEMQKLSFIEAEATVSHKLLSRALHNARAQTRRAVITQAIGECPEDKCKFEGHITIINESVELEEGSVKVKLKAHVKAGQPTALSTEEQVSLYKRFAADARRDEKWSKALKLLETALVLAEKDASIHYLIAKTKMHAGDLDGALETLSKVTKLDPNNKELRQKRVDLEAAIKKAKSGSEE
ncbi:tetratricopeptide repeat protein [Myxococcota bacterium]|nr:tetratricopeptide repeat protein [Myxococcota bacterium]